MCDECDKRHGRKGPPIGVAVHPVYEEHHEAGPDAATADVVMRGTPHMAEALKGFEIMSNTVTQDADSGAAITLVVAGNEEFMRLAKEGQLAYMLGASMSATSFKDTMKNLAVILQTASQNAGLAGGMRDDDERPEGPKGSGTLH